MEETTSSFKKALWLLGQRRKLVSLTTIVFVSLLVGLAIYSDFVFGNKTLLYKDIGSDSLNFHYPYYTLFSDYLRKEGIPSWSFQVGMGHNLFPLIGSLLFEPVAWLPKSAIAHALVYQHIAKVLIAALLFFRFLQLRNLTYLSSLTGTLLLSFSAYTCMGSCWYVLADEVLCFTVLLLAAEEAVICERWLYLVLAVALVGLLTAFHVYLCALLLCFYVPVRLIERYSWQPRAILHTCLLLAAATALGVCLVAIVTIGNFYSLVDSPRGLGPVSLREALSTFPILGLESPLHYVTAALRPFANDMLGTGSSFRGWQNYLEAPMSYCGLLSLVFFPQVFIGATRRQRILYGLFLALIIAPTAFPWFRYLFWGFQGDYYRVFSLFSVFGIVTLSMTAFSRYIENRSLNVWLLLLTLFVLFAVLYLPFRELQAVINPRLRLAATFFLIAYAAILIIGKLMRGERIAAGIIVAIVVAELICFDRVTVSHRPTVTKQELKQRVGYNDETVDAVHDINANDESLFRITKTWSSGPSIYRSLNDAMVFGYNGTASYSSFNNLNYIKFLMAVDAIPQNATESDTRWARGLLDRPLLSAFACEKYVLTRNPVPWQVADHYQFLKRYGSVYLFRNRLFLPFGLTFNRYIPEEMFLQLPSSDKPLALLHAVVLSNQLTQHYRLPQMTLEELRQQMSTTSLPDTIAARRTAALIVHSFRQTRIDGTVRLDRKGVLVLQTPFDIGWHAFENGRPAPVFKVDAGLLGVALNQGEHAVQLRYRPPFVATGAAVSLASLLILVVSLWRWPRVRLPDATCAFQFGIKTNLRTQ